MSRQLTRQNNECALVTNRDLPEEKFVKNVTNLLLENLAIVAEDHTPVIDVRKTLVNYIKPKNAAKSAAAGILTTGSYYVCSELRNALLGATGNFPALFALLYDADPTLLMLISNIPAVTVNGFIKSITFGYVPDTFGLTDKIIEASLKSYRKGVEDNTFKGVIKGGLTSVWDFATNSDMTKTIVENHVRLAYELAGTMGEKLGLVLVLYLLYLVGYIFFKSIYGAVTARGRSRTLTVERNPRMLELNFGSKKSKKKKA